MISKVRTDVPGLDTLTAGGLPEGRATLITGKSGVGKTVLSLQIACNLARQGKPVLYFTSEEEPDDILVTGEGLGYGTEELRQRNLFRVASASPALEGVTAVTGAFDVGGLIHRIEHEKQLFGVQLVVIDSANVLLCHGEPEPVLRNHFSQLVQALRRLGLTAVLNSEASADYGSTLTKLGVEDFVCDVVLILRNVIDGEKRRRSLEVHKYRRSPHYKGQYPCTLTSKGMTIFPLDASVDPASHTSERFSTGIRGLDEMNHGGWLRDSIVLVRGPSGSGKTTLAAMYARSGAVRGEKVVYYGFEETRPMLLRNLRSVGLALEDLEKSQCLRVVCRYPEATSPEDMLVDLRGELDEFRPSLVVLDSISSIEHATPAVGFRQFMVGLSSLLRERGRSALLTQTISSKADLTVPYVSTIADVMLDLDYRRFPEGVERTIRVLKMRGSSHSAAAHKFELGPGGLLVSQLAAPGN